MILKRAWVSFCIPSTIHNIEIELCYSRKDRVQNIFIEYVTYGLSVTEDIGFQHGYG